MSRMTQVFIRLKEIGRSCLSRCVVAEGIEKEVRRIVLLRRVAEELPICRLYSWANIAASIHFASANKHMCVTTFIGISELRLPAHLASKWETLLCGLLKLQSAIRLMEIRGDAVCRTIAYRNCKTPQQCSTGSSEPALIAHSTHSNVDLGYLLNTHPTALVSYSSSPNADVSAVHDHSAPIARLRFC